MTIIDNGCLTVGLHNILIFRGKILRTTENSIQFVFVGYEKISIKVQDECIEQNIRPYELF